MLLFDAGKATEPNFASISAKISHRRDSANARLDPTMFLQPLVLVSKWK